MLIVLSVLYYTMCFDTGFPHVYNLTSILRMHDFFSPQFSHNKHLLLCFCIAVVSIPPEFFAGTPVYIYNIFCTFFATVGICGALYQLSPRQPRVNLRTQRETDLFLGQNYIITWLTLADLLAASGIVLSTQ